MKKYPKIDSLYKRDSKKKLMIGQYSCPEFKYLRDVEWEFTEKVDGMNIRVGLDVIAMYTSCKYDRVNRGDVVTFFPSLCGKKARNVYVGRQKDLTGMKSDYEEKYDHFSRFIFRGRTDNATIPESLQKKLEELFYGKEMLWCKQFATAIASRNKVVIYGEGYGPKINGGEKYGKEVNFVVFDIRVGNWWLQRDEIEEICDKLGLHVVPTINDSILDSLNRINTISIFHLENSCSLVSVQNVISSHGGFKSHWGDFKAEGLVAKPKVPLLKRNGDRVITKLVYSDYLNSVPYFPEEID